MTDDKSIDRLEVATRADGGISVDITEQRDEILVGADLPGFRKQDIDVSVSERRLTIEASRDRGAVTETVDLPEPVDASRVDASYDDDVLWVTLRKRR